MKDKDSFYDILHCFFSELEGLSVEHEELTDTDVREVLHLALNYYFVWGMPCDRFPKSYGMFTYSGDCAVANVVEKFLQEACKCTEYISRHPGKPRLDMLQNTQLETRGGSCYDEFIGHVDEPLELESLPEEWFNIGEYDE